MPTKEEWKEQFLDLLRRNKDKKFLTKNLITQMSNLPFIMKGKNSKEAIEELKEENKIEFGVDDKGNKWLRYKEKR